MKTIGLTFLTLLTIGVMTGCSAPTDESDAAESSEAITSARFEGTVTEPGGEVIDDDVNVRDVATTNSAVVRKLHEGSRVHVVESVIGGVALGYSDLWYRLDDGGYVSALFVTPDVTVDDASEVTLRAHIASHRLEWYLNGALVKRWVVNTGREGLETPPGTYEIFSKLDLRDMRGTNPDGSPYLQPGVPWVMYWKEGGYAIHGSYWRPDYGLDSSHGCISLPSAVHPAGVEGYDLPELAKWLYDHTPLHTRLINTLD
jgi:hypothetical protein